MTAVVRTGAAVVATAVEMVAGLGALKEMVVTAVVRARGALVAGVTTVASTVGAAKPGEVMVVASVAAMVAEMWRDGRRRLKRRWGYKGGWGRWWWANINRFQNSDSAWCLHLHKVDFSSRPCGNTIHRSQRSVRANTVRCANCSTACNSGDFMSAQVHHPDPEVVAGAHVHAICQTWNEGYPSGTRSLK